MNYAGAGFILLSSDLSTTLLVNDTRSHKWGFPKGHREDTDANDLETSVREVREETGLTADDYNVYPEVFKVSKGSHSYNFRYAVLLDEKRKANVVSGPAEEIGGIQWVPIKQLLEAQNVLDGNKYLRAWLQDLRTGSPKKSVNLFKSLMRQGASSLPLPMPLPSST
jgi:8-oxo-dGTP pyrophosphatase MutT (NUDIX family)